MDILSLEVTDFLLVPSWFDLIQVFLHNKESKGDILWAQKIK